MFVPGRLFPSLFRIPEMVWSISLSLLPLSRIREGKEIQVTKGYIVMAMLSYSSEFFFLPLAFGLCICCQVVALAFNFLSDHPHYFSELNLVFVHNNINASHASPDQWSWHCWACTGVFLVKDWSSHHDRRESSISSPPWAECRYYRKRSHSCQEDGPYRRVSKTPYEGSRHTTD